MGIMASGSSHCFLSLQKADQPAVAKASAPGVAATAPVDEGGEEVANSTAGLVAQVWMTNWPVAVLPPCPDTPPAEPPEGLEACSPKP